jgi:Domain of unknown function (DUF4397)
MRLPRFIRRAIALAVVPFLLFCVPAVASASVAATSTGWVRLAHLSPNTPAVDVYLYSFGDTSAQLVLHHVGYGDVSPYEPLAAGEYTVAMRAAGAPAASKPVLSANLTVEPGHAYTVAGVGPESGLRLQVLDDQLTTPSGKALVRVIQASLRQHVVTVTYSGDAAPASNLAFASVTPYSAVSATSATVRVTGGSEHATASVTLGAGTVHTLVVLDGAKGLVVDNLLDAAGSGTVPAGGASTGLGGTAPRAPASPLPWLLAIGAGVLLAIAGGVRLRGLPRPRS